MRLYWLCTIQLFFFRNMCLCWKHASPLTSVCYLWQTHTFFTKFFVTTRRKKNLNKGWGHLIIIASSDDELKIHLNESFSSKFLLVRKWKFVNLYIYHVTVLHNPAKIPNFAFLHGFSVLNVHSEPFTRFMYSCFSLCVFFCCIS